MGNAASGIYNPLMSHEGVELRNREARERPKVVRRPRKVSVYVAWDQAALPFNILRGVTQAWNGYSIQEQENGKRREEQKPDPSAS